MARAKYNRTSLIANAIKLFSKNSNLSSGAFHNKVLFYRIGGRITVMSSHERLDIVDGSAEEGGKPVFYSQPQFAEIRKRMGEVDLSACEVPGSEEWMDLVESHDAPWVNCDRADINAVPPSLSDFRAVIDKAPANNGRANLKYVYPLSQGNRLPAGWVYTDGHFMVFNHVPDVVEGTALTLNTVRLLTSSGITPMFAYVDPRAKDYVSVDALTDSGDTLSVSARVGDTGAPPATSSINQVVPDPANRRIFVVYHEDMTRAQLKSYTDLITRITCSYDENAVTITHRTDDGTDIMSVVGGAVDSTEGLDIEEAKEMEAEQEKEFHFSTELLMLPLEVDSEEWTWETTGARAPITAVSSSGTWKFLIMGRKV